MRCHRYWSEFSGAPPQSYSLTYITTCAKLLSCTQFIVFLWPILSHIVAQHSLNTHLFYSLLQLISTIHHYNHLFNPTQQLTSTIYVFNSPLQLISTLHRNAYLSNSLLCSPPQLISTNKRLEFSIVAYADQPVVYDIFYGSKHVRPAHHCIKLVSALSEPHTWKPDRSSCENICDE
jgi:hypothetical protein